MTYRSRPERKGYRLTEEGEDLYAEWLDMGGCSCHTACAPCSQCTHDGHPISLEETDEVWEPEFTEYLIDYTDEYGLPTCVIGCAAGSGFCVGSCQHFERVEKCGAGLERIYCKFIEETEGGNDVSRSDVINVKENVSSPPQPETKKEFKVGYWYRCIDAGGTVLQNGDYYQVMGKEYSNDTDYLVGLKGHGRTYSKVRFDVNSESSFNPAVKVNVIKARPVLDNPQFYLGEWKEDTNNLFKQTEEKQTMSNANRRVVNVKLLDNDSGLPVEYALVAQFQGIVTEDSDEVVKQEILLNKNIADAIAKHNEKRVEQTDLEILKRTGNDVKLRQVKLKDLTWIVSAA